MELNLIKEQMAHDYSRSVEIYPDVEAAVDSAFKAGFDARQQLLQQTTCYVQLTPLLCHYDAWCKETKRNGSVLVGSSIREFIEYLEAKTNEEIQKAFIAS